MSLGHIGNLQPVDWIQPAEPGVFVLLVRGFTSAPARWQGEVRAAMALDLS